MTKTVMLPQQSRGVSLRAASFNADENTVDICFTTGAPVQRYSWGDGPYTETLDVTPAAIRLGRLNAGAPFLNTHSDYDLSDVIGVLVEGSARVENGEGLATIKLSSAAGDADIVSKIRDGIICNVSVGYIVHQAVWTEAKDGVAATCRVTDWEPLEISAVPIPADPSAQIRSNSTPAQTRTFPCAVAGIAEQPAAEAAPDVRSSETSRIQGILKVARSLGLPETLTDQAIGEGTALDAFRALAIDARASGVASTSTASNPTAAIAASEGAPAMNDRVNDTHAQDSVLDTTRAAPTAPLTPPAGLDETSIRSTERQRIVDIRTAGRKLGLGDEVIDRAVDAGVSIEAFRATAIDAVAARHADGQFAISPGAADPSHRHYAEPAEKLAKGTDASRAMLALAACRGSKREAADFVDKHYGRSGQTVARALTTSIGTAGGFLVPDAMSTEVIELLRPESVVMSLGPNIIPMPSGNFSMGRVSGGANAAYVGETNNIPASQQTFGKMQLSAKKLAALVPLSNDMIRFPSVAIDTIVRNDMIAAIAQYGDFAFIRGAGTQYSPKGFRYLAADPALNGLNVITATPAPSLTAVTTDLGNLELALANANVKMRKPGWIMSQRTRNYLFNLRDGLGNQVFAEEMSNGMLRGKPFRATTQIPNNLAATTDGTTPSTDGSEIYIADFAEVYIGEAYGLEIDVFPGGTYVDATGTLVSGISTDETVMRAIVQHDINMRQQPAVAVLTGVRWY